MEINREIKNITSAFVLEDNLTECVPYGSGHINDTYRLTYDTGKHYILQKMNRSIFTKPVENYLEGVVAKDIYEETDVGYEKKLSEAKAQLSLRDALSERLSEQQAG